MCSDCENSLSMEKIFTNIYKKFLWGPQLSGCGSSFEFNKDYFYFMYNFIQKNNIHSVVDLGCGDFVVSRNIFLGSDVEYIGIDCVKVITNFLNRIYCVHRNIKFLYYDILSRKEDIPSSDLFLIKDVFQHWPNIYIYEFLDYMIGKHNKSIFMIINSCNQTIDNKDLGRIGGYRPLSAKMMPLKRYDMAPVFYYRDKEVALIRPK